MPDAKDQAKRNSAVRDAKNVGNSYTFLSTVGHRAAVAVGGKSDDNDDNKKSASCVRIE